MPKSKVGNPSWKEFELLISKIQKETAPNAVVRHNHKVVGKSGRCRQIDVSITARVGLHDVFIVLECKDQKRSVSISQVESFVTKLRDVQASQGVIVSNSGFSGGAIAIARSESVGLFSFRGATELDWTRIGGGDDWWKLLYQAYSNLECDILVKGATSFESVPVSTQVLNSIDKNRQTLQDFFSKVFNAVIFDLSPGPFEVEVGAIPNSVFLESRNGDKEVDTFRFRADFRIIEYVVNAQLAGGHVLEDPESQEVVYTKVWTQGFDTHEIPTSQTGRLISAEEYAEIKKGNGWHQLPRPLKPEERFLRVQAVKVHE